MNTLGNAGVIGGFQQQVTSRPEAIALRFEARALSYRELDERSNHLALRLREAGLGPHSLVGIALDRSFEMVIAVLGVLKAGAAYLPLDPTYPASRLAFMLEDAKVSVLLTSRALRSSLPATGAQPWCLDDESETGRAPTGPAFSPAPNDLAYVIYTSGSTGNPKGVALGHGALANLIAWQRETSQAGVGDVTLQFAPLSFDVHFQEIFATLSTGGTLLLVSDALRLDAVRLLTLLRDQHVSRLFLPFIALQNLSEIATTHGLVPAHLTEVVTAGEQLQVTSHLVRFFEALPQCRLFNHYGPSETHVVTSYALEGPPSTWPRLPPIGKALPHCETHVLDESLRPVPRGESGELFLGGVCLAEGYLHRPELTAEKFISHPFDPSPGARLYRTGDLARVNDDGQLEYLGRLDGQVKIRGYRVELGEVEVALAGHPRVRQAAATVREDDPGEKRLVAYVVLDAPVESLGQELRRHLAASGLPDYMLPSAYVALESLPRTPSGKVDRRALPAPSRERPALSQPFVAAGTEHQRLLAGLWQRLLRIDEVGIHDNFFEIGGNSLLALQCIAHLRAEHGFDLSIVRLFQVPTVAELAKTLAGEGEDDGFYARAEERMKHAAGGTKHPAIAVIGMAGRFPGAPDLEAFWKNLCEGIESVRFFAESELHPSVPASLRTDPAYVKARGVLDGADLFDAAFFGITPREAEVMDPQQRLFLEVAYEAMERAGLVPERYPGLVGVYAGTHNNSYFPHNVATRPDLVERLGAFTAMVANEKDYVATRVAHKLGLTGPALSLHTACSTSLVAVCEAFHHLVTHRVDVAFAGGAALTVPQQSGHLYQEGGILSDDGHCRPFDADAKGTLFSDGVGCVVLKRLEDAERDGDVIHAILRGAAVNNDGDQKMSFAAPSVMGQAAVVAMAQANAGVDPRSISYVEAHGTATLIGDPIEVEGLTRAFRAKTPDKQFCALGSVKGNFGHLTAAAGIAGLLKTVLSLEAKQLPPTVHFRRPNPKIDFENSPFFVNAKLSAWSGDAGPRRAGVSSFGVGGTNAHVVLEEAPARESSGVSRPSQLLLLSARTAAALDARASDLATQLESSPQPPLADVAYTLAVGRRNMPYRRALVGANASELVKALREGKSSSAHLLKTEAPPVAFLFTGQGAQFVGMGRALYENEPEFRVVVDRCAAILQPLLGRDLRTVMFEPATSPEDAAERLRPTSLAQPALFTYEYALANLWQSWGIRPQAMAGHSIGEWVAACVAGVFSLEDALRLVARRGELMQSQPTGSMHSVRLPAAKVLERLPPDLSIASHNAPSLCVVAGPTDSVARFVAELEQDGVVTRALHTSHAFHSAMMDPIVEPFAELVSKVKLSAPRHRIVSTATGTWMTDAEAQNPRYWASHLRATVRFSEAIQTLWLDPALVLLEAGPRGVLTTLARQHVQDRTRQIAIASTGDGQDAVSELPALLAAAGQLWCRGVDVDWDRLYAHERRRKVVLPSYPFERQRHWIEPSLAPVASASLIAPVVAPGVTVNAPAQPSAPTRLPRLISELRQTLEDLSGLEFDGAESSATFFELGLDSLALTQVALELQRKYALKLTFRQLVEEYATLDLLAAHLDAALPREAAPAIVPAPAPTPVIARSSAVLAPMVGGSALESVIEQQLRLMAQQLELLRGAGPTITVEARPVAPAAPPPPAPITTEAPKPFGAIARISLSRDELTPGQRQQLEALTARYNAKTKSSKAYAQEHRAHLADPRVVTGFRPVIKELIYPIVIDRSSGSRLWDLDGNEYVDALNGFGSNMFGYAPSFITDAVKRQIDRGYELGPQHALAGEVAKLVCEFTGMDRAGLCNTGSEAVMGAMRVARTVTGRSLIAIFTGSYHGIFDEVIVRGSRSLRSIPAAPGIMPESVQNVLVLEYGTPETLEILKARAHELAAVMVEPIQSRRPDFQPREFLHEVRRITEQSGSALIFDEVITGFRLHPGGAQAHFEVKADLATYGKVVGGGMPIGVIAGKRAWMDALDGGHWQYGDASMPTVGVTYFAGTFVRHPLALAAAKASLDFMKEKGPALQRDLNAATTGMAKELNAHFESVGVPLKIKHFGSLWKAVYTEEQAHGDLLFCHLRDKGLHIWDGFPCFLTIAHSPADVALITRCFRESIAEMQGGGFLPAPPKPAPQATPAFDADRPPVPGARLGRDPSGNPAWFVPNPDEPGRYLKLGGN